MTVNFAILLQTPNPPVLPKQVCEQGWEEVQDFQHALWTAK